MKRLLTRGAATLLLAVPVISGCGGSDPGDKGGGGLEKSEIKIGVLPIADDAPVFLAEKNGYFKEQGLKVKTLIMKNGAEGLARLQSGAVDATFSSYPTVISAATNGLKVKILVDGYAARKNMYSVMAMPESGIKTPADLRGKKIAINNSKGLGPLLVESSLKAAAVDPKSVKLIQVPFPDMPGALQKKTVDAVWVDEPFHTQVAQRGAKEVLDTASGSTENFPVAGYIAAQHIARQNPKTMAAFQRAMAKAQVVANDRRQVSRVLPSYTKITPELASIITVGQYPTSMNKTRLQRVADLMTALGFLKTRFDVQPLLG